MTERTQDTTQKENQTIDTVPARDKDSYLRRIAELDPADQAYMDGYIHGAINAMSRKPA